MTVPADEEDVVDVLGVGFGPANLALAVALEEHNASAPERSRLKARFFEKQAAFGWHRGMLIDGATMQISFLKDLALPRNPSSDFTFLSYLHNRERLSDFINHKVFYPSRVEYHDYLTWAAGRLDHLVRYDAQVVDMCPVLDGDVVDHLAVVARLGGHDSTHVEVVRANNVVLGVGMEPTVPPGTVLGERVWHNSDLVHRVARMAGERPRRFVVVGAGQSAAETVEYLHRQFEGAEICAVFSRYGYSVADDSPFTNRIFDPEAVDHFYAAPQEVKTALLGYHANTNYAVVDADLIEELYRRTYQEQVTGDRRLRFMPASVVRGVRTGPAGVEVHIEFRPTGERVRLDADVLVYATGYRPIDPAALLGETVKHCERDDQGNLRVGRDYRVALSGGASRCGLYVHGCTESTHGISSSLLSNVATRAEEIRCSLIRQAAAPLSMSSARERIDPAIPGPEVPYGCTES